MPSTVSTPVTARIPNSQLAVLRQLAELLGTTPSLLVAVSVGQTLALFREMGVPSDGGGAA